MEEVFPVLAGVVVGLVSDSVRLVWLRVLLLVLSGIGFGVMASWISGELAMSWIYVLIDTAEVIVVAAMTIVGMMVWRRRLATKMARYR
jgi:uncharacterized membrane protein